MRIYRALCCVTLGALAAGCELAELTSANLTGNVRRSTNGVWEHIRNGSLANASWEQFQTTHRGQPYSADFALGFKGGFADYVFAGGSGNPPPLPAHHYWSYHYETGDGYAAIQDWFAGWRAGATAAETSGCRGLTLVPVASPQPPAQAKSQVAVSASTPR